MESLHEKAKLAQLRADMFANQAALNNDKESETLRKLEAQWSKSFEEKTMAVNQLERELACTVDELHRSRNTTFVSQSVPNLNSFISQYHQKPFPVKVESENITLCANDDTIVQEMKRLNKLLSKQMQLIASLESNICTLRVALSDSEGKLNFRNSQVYILSSTMLLYYTIVNIIY